jgi:hypothetical protein
MFFILYGRSTYLVVLVNLGGQLSPQLMCRQWVSTLLGVSVRMKACKLLEALLVHVLIRRLKGLKSDILGQCSNIRLHTYLASASAH